MATYRAIFIDSQFEIAEKRDIQAEDDGKAISTALGWLNGQTRTIEVWNGEQQIAMLRSPNTIVLSPKE